jgi:hypothetical protein
MRMLIIVLIFFTGNIASSQVSTSHRCKAPSDQGYGSVNYNNPSELEQKSR